MTNSHLSRLQLMVRAMSAGVLVASSSLAFVTSAQANSVEAVLDAGNKTIVAAQQSQKNIDSIADQTDDLLQQYKKVNKDIEGLKVYNAQTQARIDNQLERIADLEESLAGVTVIQRQIPPLLERMLTGLEQFVELDVPFKKAEREAQLAQLRANMGKSNQTVAENFRQVLEAYKIENEYGRKIEAYEEKIDFNGDGTEVNVDVFRVGRIALVYKTKDGLQVGRWNNDTRSWEALDTAEWSGVINTGIRIARNEAVKDVLQLPIAAPEAAQ